ncbi:hypothetical protein LSTR_LSTR006208 [Laodelphax striatellus]|uniref:Uncharacterized protein n=1 Tax=Laodelphax striatellus TaxID=195883 RepID=A0A482WYW8_LAOST|nr:hypothetical protein LSTR_LSTR016924 [Laodelphax striatellus]RZF48241.1 hypothetical protein LSTR_LSTR006208 [Laodelphax striatellus]
MKVWRAQSEEGVRWGGDFGKARVFAVQEGNGKSSKNTENTWWCRRQCGPNRKLLARQAALPPPRSHTMLLR